MIYKTLNHLLIFFYSQLELSKKYPSTHIDSWEYWTKSKVIFIKFFKIFKIFKNLKGCAETFKITLYGHNFWNKGATVVISIKRRCRRLTVTGTGTQLTRSGYNPTTVTQRYLTYPFIGIYGQATVPQRFRYGQVF